LDNLGTKAVAIGRSNGTQGTYSRVVVFIVSLWLLSITSPTTWVVTGREQLVLQLNSLNAFIELEYSGCSCFLMLVSLDSGFAF
jgi:hypothetical protein